jgi:hypothetical protein
VITANGRYISLISTAAVVPVPTGITGMQVFVVPNPLTIGGS